MKISTILTPAEIALLPQADLAGTAAVVFDILRATSTITTALHYGGAAIFPAADIAEALALKRRLPHALLGGERHGEKIEGFDVGNSPLEMCALAGAEIISTTTNGTVALRAVVHADTIIAESFLNLTATATYLRAISPEKLLLVCAGTGSEFAIEDGLAAGALLEAIFTKDDVLDDAGEILLTLWRRQRENVGQVLADSRNGRRLIERGREAEVAWCAQIDVCPTVGSLSDGAMQVSGLPS